jgi:adenine phosphoribosyltransferase
LGELEKHLLDRFAWVNGHADVWRLFYDREIFSRLIAALADPYRGDSITKVVGIEARGFVLAAPVAIELGAGFAAIRKGNALFPGETLSRVTADDYRGRNAELRLQRESVTRGDRVLLVDDWFETGSQGLAAQALITEAGGTFAGASVIVDQLPADTRRRFERYSSLIDAAALPASTPRSFE